MVMLHTTLRVTYIPTLNPGKYLEERRNSNGVDIFHNFDFFWNRYTPPDAMKYKGAARYSVPEAKIVKNIHDRYHISATIDCHITKASVRNAMEWVSPPSWMAAHRDTAFWAGQHWDASYNPGRSPVREMVAFGNYDSVHTFCSWAAYYAQHV